MTNDSDAPQNVADVAEVGPILCMLVDCGWHDVHRTERGGYREPQRQGHAGTDMPGARGTSYWPGQYGAWRLPGSLRNKSSAGRGTGSQRHAKKLEGNRGTHGFRGTGESGVPTHPRKDSRTDKRSSASKTETREASNDGPGLGNSRGKKHGSRQTRPEWVGRSGQQGDIYRIPMG